MSTIEGRALAAIPGYTDLTGQLNRLEAHVRDRRAAPRPGSGRAALVAEARAALAAGGVPPEDLGARLVAAEQAERAAALAAELLGPPGGHGGGLVRDLMHERGQLVARDVDPALEVLRGELAQVLADVAAADQILGSVASAAAAVEVAIDGDTGPAEAWRSLAGLDRRYGALRQAQQALYRTQIGGPTDELRLLFLSGVVVIDNLDDVDPDWLRRGAGVRVERPPWPSPATGEEGWWPTEDRTAYLRWLAVGPARPWVPPLAEARARRRPKLAVGGVDPVTGNRVRSYVFLGGNDDV